MKSGNTRQKLDPFTLGLGLLAFCLLLLLLSSSSEEAEAVTHSGALTSDETWLAADNPHQITADVAVGDYTLEIEAGAVVELDASTRLTAGTDGEIYVNGTVADPVWFNNTPGHQDWDRIYMSRGILEVHNTTFQECSMAIYATWPSTAALATPGGSGSRPRTTSPSRTS
jgi:hypothetical protein